MGKKSEKELEYLKYLWFDTLTSPLLDGWPKSKRDKNYYVNKFYDLINYIDLPDTGKLLVLGTHNCISFDKLCNYYGFDRCIGFDLHNPSKHPNVIIKDCDYLSKDDDLPLAFCHNDIGSFWQNPNLKLACQEWAAKNIIKGGYFLGNNDYNRPRIKLESLMEKWGFINIQLEQFIKDENIKINIDRNIIRGYMISKKL